MRRPAVSWRQKDIQLTLGFQEPRNGGGSAVPVRRFDLKLPFPCACKEVKLRAARVLGLPPLGIQPSSTLQPLQGRKQRSGIYLEHSARNLLDPACNAEAMHGLEAQRLENQHIERTLDYIGGALIHARTIVALI